MIVLKTMFWAARLFFSAGPIALIVAGLGDAIDDGLFEESWAWWGWIIAIYLGVLILAGVLICTVAIWSFFGDAAEEVFGE